MKIHLREKLVLAFWLWVSLVYAHTPTDSLKNKVASAAFTVATGNVSNGDESVLVSAITSQRFEEGLLPSSDPIDSVQYYIDKAKALVAKVRETQNYITNLNDASLFELPAGIPKIIDGLNYDIVIEAIRLKPTHAEVDVYMQFEIPQNGKLLTFRGKGIKFTRAGGIVGDAQLQLIGDYGINFSGDKIQLILHGSLSNTGTYVTMDCDGFKGMGIDAEVKFSRDLLVPEDENGTILEGNVSASCAYKKHPV